MICVIDGNKGIYVPQEFAKLYKYREMSSEMRENFNVLLQGPDTPEYWEAWEDVLDNFHIIGKDGRRYTFFQDQDVFAVDVLQRYTTE